MYLLSIYTNGIEQEFRVMQNVVADNYHLPLLFISHVLKLKEKHLITLSKTWKNHPTIYQLTCSIITFTFPRWIHKLWNIYFFQDKHKHKFKKRLLKMTTYEEKWYNIQQNDSQTNLFHIKTNEKIEISNHIMTLKIIIIEYWHEDLQLIKANKNIFLDPNKWVSNQHLRTNMQIL